MTHKKCYFCGANEADYITTLKNKAGKESEIHLCEGCAEEILNGILNLKYEDEFAEEVIEELDEDNDFRREEEEQEREMTVTKRKIFSGPKLRPKEIMKFLDDRVIGQETAKKILSVAIYNHMQRLKYYDEHKNGGLEIQKSNVWLIGPSGCGKTYMVENLAKLLQVPFAIADATTLTESGYVGADVESVLQKLLRAANGNIKLAERGIVFIDEIDKKANKGQENNSITRDVSGEGVQQALLKLMEGGIVDVQESGERRHPYAETVPINTKNILFIVGGAFVGIEKIIEKRLQGEQRRMGITLNESQNTKLNIKGYNELIDSLTGEDLRQYGMIPEFLGRIPVIAPVHQLDKEELVKVLTEPKSAIIKQYQALLEEDNITLRFQDKALAVIAEAAIRRKVGARGLRSIMEYILCDIMFEIPGSGDPNAHQIIEITEAYVKRKLKGDLNGKEFYKAS